MYFARIRRSSCGRAASEGMRYSGFKRLGNMDCGSGEEK